MNAPANIPAQPHGLTGKLGEIADVAGVAAALKLARALGGQELKLSSAKGGKLAKIVGQTAADAIVETFGRGEKLTVPMGHLRGQRARREAVVKMIAEGASTAEASYAADVHERTGRRVRQRPPARLPLFDD